MAPRCKAITEAGTRCKIQNDLRRTEDGWRCLWHDPERAKKAAAARKRGARKGGRRRAGFPAEKDIPPTPETLDDATKYAAWITDQLARGMLDPKRGAEMIRALAQFTRSFEKAALAKQVRELQSQLKKLKKGAKA